MEEDLPLLKDYVYQISPLYDLEKQITSAIDENGYVMDSASVKLRGIRSSIRDLESRVRERLNNVTRSKSKMLSDSIRSEERRVGKENKKRCTETTARRRKR